MVKKPSRRTILKAGGLAGIVGALSMSICCNKVHECVGVPLWQPVDGQIEPGTADYFNNEQAVKKYDKELAELFNETWQKEFGGIIDKHLCIAYRSEMGEFAEVNIYEEKFDFSEFKTVRKDYILMGDRYGPYKNLVLLSHGVGHEFTGPNHENIPILTGYRISTMANVHFPQFGLDTLCKAFTIGHSDVLLTARKSQFKPSDKYHRGSLAALLALNQNQGDFREAHRALAKPAQYLAQADEFTNFALAQPRQTVQRFFPSGSEASGTVPYWNLALYDLWNKVAHQIIERNVAQNPGLIATGIKDCMKKAARFPTKSIDEGDFPVSYNSYETNCQEGFTNPLGFVVEPPGYDYSIPKGLK